jgi:DNA-binding MarR family transcriptional regulator
MKEAETGIHAKSEEGLAGGRIKSDFMFVDSAGESLKRRAEIIRQVRQLLDRLQDIDSIASYTLDASSESSLRAVAKRILEARSKRSQDLPKTGLGEPCWDMLLALYAASEPISSKSVCFSAGVPYTTAWRWLGFLEQEGLVRKSSDHNDGRRVMICLTTEGTDTMYKALQRLTVHLNGLSIVGARDL